MAPKHFSVRSHIVPTQHIRGYYHATANSQEEELQLAVKQYIPLDNPNPSIGDVTIIACHAAGFFKELFEPFFDDLHEALKPHTRIRGIWIADTASHGKSSILNEGKLGNDPCWDDHARDLLQMINIFRSEMPAPIVGIGHSMGGTNIVQLALLHPRLLSTVICIEPIINRSHKGMNFSPAYGLSYRKDVWPSREEAATELKSSILHRSWDSRVLDLYIEYGLRDLPTLLYPELPAKMSAKKKPLEGETAVTLTTTKHHNVRSYARAAFPPPAQPLDTFEIGSKHYFDLTKSEHGEMQAPIYRPEAILTFRKLPLLRPSCLYVYGADSPFSSASPRGRADKIEVTGTATGGSGGSEKGRVAEVILGGGHFVVFEHPEDVAREAGAWLEVAMGRWKMEIEAEKEGWEGLEAREKAMVDDAWMFWVKEQYGKKKVAKGEKKSDSKL